MMRSVRHMQVSAAPEDMERMHYFPCPRHNAGCAVSEGGKAYIVGGRKYSDYCVIVPGQVKPINTLSRCYWKDTFSIGIACQVGICPELGR